SGKDRERAQCQRLVHRRRYRPPRCRWLYLSDRSQGVHDYFRRREHLSAGNRECIDGASADRRCRRVRYSESGFWRRGEGRRAVARSCAGVGVPGGGADRVLPCANIAYQMPALGRFYRNAAEARQWQVVQAEIEKPVLQLIFIGWRSIPALGNYVERAFGRVAFTARCLGSGFRRMPFWLSFRCSTELIRLTM